MILISTHAEADFADLIADSPATGFLPKSELSAERDPPHPGSAARADAALAGVEEGEHREDPTVIVLGPGRRSFARMLRTCFSTVPSVTHSRGRSRRWSGPPP